MISIETFILINVVLVVGLLLLFRSKPHRPSRLKMDSKTSDSFFVNSIVSSEEQELIAKSTEETFTGEKDLNVIFEYQGKSYDAYEILEIPARSSKQSAQKAYLAALSKKSKSQNDLELLKKALDAIINNK